MFRRSWRAAKIAFSHRRCIARFYGMMHLKTRRKVDLIMAEENSAPAINEDDVKEVLNAIRPSLQADGGDVELVSVAADGTVTVELQGACKGCPMSQMTLANGVERILKERVPGVTKVVPSDIPEEFGGMVFD